ncbi:unnamed protein product [Candidula unifasciata]|uniref:GA-binding protein alpha chain n=1 Tax=Candidula unifasciata TaxID=100452 RepID=A0A8S3Z0M6_9EUPU|nr:unnamed protein product [Candidula unifasciata]
MKRAFSPALMEVVAEAVNAVDGDIMTEIITELPMHGFKRQKIEEVCLDDGIIYEQDYIQQPAPHYQNLIIQHMDIAEPLSTLKHLLEVRLQCSLTGHQFFLQDSIELDGDKSLVDQCVQGEGMVQVNLEIKSQPGVQPKINILDILKTAEEEMEDKYVAENDIESDHSQGSRVVPLSDETENVTKWVIDQGFRRDQERLKIPADPCQWSELHVKHWLQWAVKEFHLQGVDVGAFNFDGEQLFTMSHPEFIQHIPHDPGDLFWTHLELLRKCKFVAVMQQPMHTVTITVPSDMDGRYGRVKAIARHRPRLVGEDRLSPGNRTGNNGQIQLWQFLLELLTDRMCREVITWLGTDGEFKLINPELVARMWGQRKNKPTMNYEKLSRALRYYYDGDMISKVHGKRFVYKFVCDLQMLVGYTAAELSRLVGADEIHLVDSSQLQRFRTKATYIATMKEDPQAAEAAAHFIEQQNAARIIEHRSQIVQTME